MKRFLSICCVFVLSISFIQPLNTYALQIIDPSGEMYDFDAMQPFVQNGRTMFPLTYLDKILTAFVTCSVEDERIDLMKDVLDFTTELHMEIGSHILYKNGEAIEMDTAPVQVDGHIFVPLRYVAEAFECGVYWDSRNDLLWFQPCNMELYAISENKDDTRETMRYVLLPGILRNRTLDEIQSYAGYDYSEIVPILESYKNADGKLIIGVYTKNAYPESEYSALASLWNSQYTVAHEKNLPFIVKNGYDGCLYSLLEKAPVDAHMYRFTLECAFDVHIAICIDIHESGEGTLHFSMKRISDASCEMIRHIEKEIPKEKVQSLLDIIELKQKDVPEDKYDTLLYRITPETTFWEMHPEPWRMPLDSQIWTVEGTKHGQYHVVERRSPKGEPIYAIGMKFITLTGEELDVNGYR